MAILTLFLSGAAMAAVISIPAPSIPPLLAQPLPIKIGLCVTSALRGAHLRQLNHRARLEAGAGAPGQGPDWQLGDAAVGALTTVTRAAFAEVAVLDGCVPNATPPRDFPAILVPELISADVPLTGTASDGNNLHARVELRMTLLSTPGTSTVSWDVSGAEPIRFGLLRKSSPEETARALSAALRDACARLIADLYVNAEVHPWLTNLTIGQSVDSDNAADVANDSGIALLNYGLDARVAQRMTDCITSTVTKQGNKIKVTDAQQAKNAFFPWLEESVVSFSPKQAATLLSNRMIQQRSRESRLRYVVFITEEYGSSHMKGPFFCGGGYGGAGCLGAAGIARETTVHAVVWDLERGRQAELSATENAHDLLVGFVLPLWIPGGLPTTTQACHTMAQDLLRMVREPDAVPGGSNLEARPAMIWKSATELTDDATAAESGERPAGCLDAFTEQASGDDGNAQLVDGVMWFDGTSSVKEFMSRQPALTRVGSIAIAEQYVTFASTPGSQPEQRLRIPLTEILSVTVDGGATTLVLLKTKSACRAAFQVLDVSPSVVKQRTDAVGHLLAQRLVDFRNHAGTATP
jgi:hypothetical protein